EGARRRPGRCSRRPVPAAPTARGDQGVRRRAGPAAGRAGGGQEEPRPVASAAPWPRAGAVRTGAAASAAPCTDGAGCAAVGRTRLGSRLRDDPDPVRLRALVALRYVKLDPLAVFKRLVAVHLD